MQNEITDPAEHAGLQKVTVVMWEHSRGSDIEGSGQSHPVRPKKCRIHQDGHGILRKVNRRLCKLPDVFTWPRKSNSVLPMTSSQTSLVYSSPTGLYAHSHLGAWRLLFPLPQRPPCTWLLSFMPQPESPPQRGLPSPQQRCQVHKSFRYVALLYFLHCTSHHLLISLFVVCLP